MSEGCLTSWRGRWRSGQCGPSSRGTTAPCGKISVRDVRGFLSMLWRDGALMGKTEDEAFFVQCDDETNSPESIDMGMVVTRIGLAPVKPAEFVIFRIGQWAGGTKIESEGAKP